MKKIFRFLLLITLISVLVGCNGRQAVRQAIDLPGLDAPQAWIDAPLPGMHLPLAPYEFVAHGTDQGGISQLEWILDGSSLGIMDAKSPGEKLATFRNLWTPTAPGTYTLRVRAKNNTNAWSDFDEAIFTVGGSTGTITPTSTETSTPTPTLTPTQTISTITPTATITLTPTPVLQSGFAGQPVFSPEQIDLGRGCPAASLTAEIKVTSTQGIKVVVLFFRVADNDFVEHSEWADIAMRPVGADTYRVTFNPFKEGDFASWLTAHWSIGWEGWLTTQFVIQNNNGSYTRSDVYSQVKIGGCR